MTTGNSIAKIEGWGTVTITLECSETPTGKRSFNLYRTAYIPTFTLNLVSYNRLFNSHIYWDSQNLSLKYNGRVLGHTARLHSQWVLEYNAVSDSSVFPAQRLDQPLP
jgi:hypothetical protein